MEIPVELKNRLLSELRYVITKVNTETDPKRKAYFLSAAHGAVERTMRFHASGELNLVHFVLNVCYNTINGLLGRITGGDTAVLPPGDMWEKIIQYLNELYDKIDRGEPTYPVLEKIVVLSYSLTGPGYYTMGYLRQQETPT